MGLADRVKTFRRDGRSSRAAVLLSGAVCITESSSLDSPNGISCRPAAGSQSGRQRADRAGASRAAREPDAHRCGEPKGAHMGEPPNLRINREASQMAADKGQPSCASMI